MATVHSTFQFAKSFCIIASFPSHHNPVRYRLLYLWSAEEVMHLAQGHRLKATVFPGARSFYKTLSAKKYHYRKVRIKMC